MIQQQLNVEKIKSENETKNKEEVKFAAKSYIRNNELNKLKEQLTEEKNKNKILNKKIDDLNNIIKKQENIDIKKVNNLEEKFKTLENEINKDINLIFKSMENQKYNLKVPKNIQFTIAIQKLYNNYPILENKKIGAFVSKGNTSKLFDTIEENGLKDGDIILIINRFK